MSSTMYVGLRNHIQKQFSEEKYWKPITDVKSVLTPCGEIYKWQMFMFDQVVEFGSRCFSCIIIAKRTYGPNGELRHSQDVYTEAWTGETASTGPDNWKHFQF